MNPLLNYTVLTDVVQALKEGDIRYCEALGFTYNELQAIDALSIDDICVLCRMTVKFLEVGVKHDVFGQMLAQLSHQKQIQEQLCRAVELGGSIELISQFFGLTSGEICSRRRFAGINISQGRSRIPDEETDNRIWKLWEARRPEKLLSFEALDVMMDITEQLSGEDEREFLSLTVVWNRIMACENDIQGRGSDG